MNTPPPLPASTPAAPVSQRRVGVTISIAAAIVLVSVCLTAWLLTASGFLDHFRRQFTQGYQQGDAATKARRCNEAGLGHRRRGDLDRAIESFEEALRWNPRSIPARLNLADTYLQKRNHDGAIAHARRVLDENPRASDEHRSAAHGILGAALASKQEREAALANLSRAIELDPRNAAAYYGRARVHAETEQSDKALADLEVYLQLKPHSREALRWRGMIHQFRGDYERALADANELLRLGPQDALAYHRRAMAYLGQGNFEEARRDIEEAVRLEPQNRPARLTRARLAQKQERYPEALADYEAAAAGSPRTATFLNSLAWFLATCADEKLRDGARAGTLAREACELSSWGSPYHIDTLAAACAEEGRFEEAAAFQQQAMEGFERKPPSAANAGFLEGCRARLARYQAKQRPLADTPEEIKP